MRSEADIMKYIYDWLVGLNIGKVLQDREPFADTTGMRNRRTYIVYSFPDGIDDCNAFWQGTCVVCIGCRDKEKFVADMENLVPAVNKFIAEFDKNDEVNGVHCVGVQQTDFYSDKVGNHEYQYVFDVYADRVHYENG